MHEKLRDALAMLVAANRLSQQVIYGDDDQLISGLGQLLRRDRLWPHTREDAAWCEQLVPEALRLGRARCVVYRLERSVRDLLDRRRESFWGKLAVQDVRRADRVEEISVMGGRRGDDRVEAGEPSSLDG